MTRCTTTANAHVVHLGRRLLRDWDEPDLERRADAPAPPPAPALPIFMWLGIDPPPPTVRLCSRGCHVLPEGAKYDPHTGAGIDEPGHARRRDRALPPRLVVG